MSNVDVSTSAQSSPTNTAQSAVADTRIDAAHGRSVGPRAPHGPVPAGATAPAADAAAVPSPEEMLNFVAQLRGQAAELADYLARRQSDLDLREASLHARSADLEKQSRAARMWVLERQHELHEERSAMADRPHQPNAAELEAVYAQQQLAEQLAEREKTLGHRAEELARNELRWAEECEQQKSDLEAELWRREAQWQSPSAEQVAERRRLEDMAIKVREREQRLGRAESLLSQQQAEVESRTRQCDRLRTELDELERSQRQILVGERERSEAELSRRKLTLEQRGEELDVRAAAVEQLRGDLTRLHRETLEMRLATEELWAQLSGAMAPAALTQSLARIRAKLADYYKHSERELETRQQDLGRLAAKVTGQHDKLAARRQQVEDWASKRQVEIDQHANRLVAREQELARMERRFQKRELDWQSEREELQQEIRRLMREIRRSEAVGAA